MTNKVTVKVAAAELGESKSTIRDMIRNKKISSELINGNYYVVIDEIKGALETSNQPTNYNLVLDDVMKFILKETLIDFMHTDVSQNHKSNRIVKKVLKNGSINKHEDLEFLVGYYSNVLLDGYSLYPSDFIKWFDVKTSSEFYTLRKHYFNTNRNKSIYFEYFIMFDKLTNGKFRVINATTIQLEMIKENHCGKIVS